MTNTDNQSTLTRRAMSDAEALNLSTPYFPLCGPMEFFETEVFDLLKSWCDEYDGGTWTYYELSNGAWYLSPNATEVYGVKDCYGDKHEMTPDGAGLAATFHLLHLLLWRFHDAGQTANYEAVSEHYHALQRYTYQHPDARAIWKVLD